MIARHGLSSRAPSATRLLVRGAAAGCGGDGALVAVPCRSPTCMSPVAGSSVRVRRARPWRVSDARRRPATGVRVCDGGEVAAGQRESRFPRAFGDFRLQLQDARATADARPRQSASPFIFALPRVTNAVVSRDRLSLTAAPDVTRFSSHTAGARRAGRSGSLRPSSRPASRPGQAQCPGRCQGIAACPGRRLRGR